MLLPDERPLKPAKSPVLAPSPLQTKPPSAPSVHASSSPSSSYQAYRQGERESSPASNPKPSVHPHLPSGHISSPPRPAVRKESEWSPADEKVATHRAQTKLKTSPPAKPSKPLVTHEDDARETRRLQNQNQVSAAQQSSPPKPAPGTAGDLAAATRSRQEAVMNLRAANSLSTSFNRGGIRQMEIRDAQSSLSAADARQKSARAAQAAQDALKISPSLNRGGRRQEEINYARQTASSARTAYLGSQGLDSSGKPFVDTTPEPARSIVREENSWLDRAKDTVKHVADGAIGFVKDHPRDIGHGVLDAAGFIPGLGAVPDLANAAWYLAEGDKKNAGLSTFAAIPGFGDAAAAAVIAGKVAAKVEKGTEVATEVAGIAAKGDKGVAAAARGERATVATGARSTDAAARKEFMKVTQNQINESHPLGFLLNADGKWLSRTAFPKTEAEFNEFGVQAGHLTSRHSGDAERFALEDPMLNHLDSRKESSGVIYNKTAIDIGGIPVEKQTAQLWEELGKIPKGTVENASPHSGWTVP